MRAFSATRPGSWLVGHVAAKGHPTPFRWSRGIPRVRTDERRTTRDIPVVRLVAR